MDASNASTQFPDQVAIIGGGVIGCFLTYRFACEGVAVTLVERKHVAAEASGASAGNVQPPTSGGRLLIDLGKESLELFRRDLPGIKEESGIDPNDQDVRWLYAALDDQEAADTQATAHELTQAGLHAEWIDGQAAREMDPRLSPRLLGGMFQTGLIQMDPYLFVTALESAAKRRGAKVVHSEAIGLEHKSGRVSGVRLENGDTLPCDTAIAAMGAWTGEALSRWVGVSLPIGPRPQQKLHLLPKGPRLGCAVRWKLTNMVHRVDGKLHLGSKPDDTGFEASPSAEGREWLLERIRPVLPGLEFEVVEAAAGCGAITPGMVPILGPLGELEGMYVAASGNNGFLLSAVISQIISDLLVHGKKHPFLDEILPERALSRAATCAEPG